MIKPAPPTKHKFVIIAIHGNGGGAFRFERVHPFIPETVTFDAITLPGFADHPADPALQSMRDYANYIHRSVARYDGQKIVLLGTGIGGSMILEYVQHYPDTLAGVILHAPVGTRLDSRRFPALMKLPFMRKLGQRVFSSRLTRPLFKRLLFVDHSRIPQAFLNRFFEEYRQCTVFGQMFDLITADWYNQLRSVNQVPAALLWGEQERVLNVDHIADYQLLFPENIVHIVPEWDHFPMIEQPEHYAKEIITLSDELCQMSFRNTRDKVYRDEHGIMP